MKPDFEELVNLLSKPVLELLNEQEIYEIDNNLLDFQSIPKALLVQEVKMINKPDLNIDWEELMTSLGIMLGISGVRDIGIQRRNKDDNKHSEKI